MALSTVSTGFDNCCGVIQIVHFHGSCKDVDDDLKEIITKFPIIPLMLCVLNSIQSIKYHKTLVKHDFRIIDRAIGLNGLNLYLYCRNKELVQ